MNEHLEKNLERFIWHELVLYSLMLDPSEQVILIKLKEHYRQVFKYKCISWLHLYLHRNLWQKFSGQNTFKCIMGDFFFPIKSKTINQSDYFLILERLGSKWKQLLTLYSNKKTGAIEMKVQGAVSKQKQIPLYWVRR